MMFATMLVLAMVLDGGPATDSTVDSVDGLASELKAFCREHEVQDNMMPRGVLGTRFLTEYGSNGRLALLKVAREPNRVGTCALDILITVNDVAALSIARQLLRDRRTPGFVRAMAMGAVGHFKDQESLDVVLTAFKSADKELVGPAAYALGELRDPRGWAELEAALHSQKYVAFRYAIFSGLAQPGHERVIPLITQAVSNGQVSPGTGCSALWKIGTRPAQRAAISMLDAVRPLARASLARSFRASLVGASGPDASAVADAAADLDRIIEQAQHQHQ